MAILLHKKRVESVEIVYSISERVLAIDLRMRRRLLRLVAAYAPHPAYSQETLDLFYCPLHSVMRARGVMKTDMAYIVGGDFNTQRDVGNRGQFLDDLLQLLDLKIANRCTEFDNPHQL